MCSENEKPRMSITFYKIFSVKWLVDKSCEEGEDENGDCGPWHKSCVSPCHQIYDSFDRLQPKWQTRSEAGGRKNEILFARIDCNVAERFLIPCASMPSMLFDSPDLDVRPIFTVIPWNYYRSQIDLSHQSKSRQPCLLASCISLVLAHKARLLQ